MTGAMPPSAIASIYEGTHGCNLYTPTQWAIRTLRTQRRRDAGDSLAEGGRLG